MKRKNFLILTGSFFCVVIVSVVLRLFIINTYHFHIPITLDKSNIPETLVEIQGKKYSLAIDLGDKFALSLNKHALKKLQKKPHDSLQNRDAIGKSYETSAYVLSKIKLGDLIFDDVVVAEVNEEFVKNTILWADTDNLEELLNDRFGTIGRALLEKLNLLLDVQNSSFFASNDIKKLKENGYDLNQLVQISFEIGRTGVILPVKTEMGLIRLSIDTGSTVSLVRSSIFQGIGIKNEKHGFPIYTTSMFEIGSKNFGSMNLYLFDITPELHEIDGVLGMDFVKNHVIYIDYKDKVLYIGNSKPRIQDSKKM